MPRWRWLYGFVLPAGAMLVALVIALGLQLFGVRQVFFLFIPAVMVSAWFGGRIGGVVASTLAVILVGLLLQLPPQTWEPEPESAAASSASAASPSERVRAASFGSEGVALPTPQKLLLPLLVAEPLEGGEWLLVVLFGAVCVSVSLLTAGRRHAAAERERALREAQAARQDAEINSRLKDQFLATLSHELRTPLNAVLGWTRMLTLGQVDRAKVPAALASIERNAQAQKQLVDDLLDVSAIVTGQLRLLPREIDLADVVRAAVDAVRLSLETRHQHLDQQLEAVQIVGDADRLRQVVWNLLSNAVKFTAEGGDIVVRVTREGAVARIAVRDSGKGIAPEFLPFMFEPFRQADSSLTRASGGLGLGLSLVRYIVEGHGGRVEVSSDGLKLGSTFVVTLPVRGTSSERVRLVPPPGERDEAQQGVVQQDVAQRREEPRRGEPQRKEQQRAREQEPGYERNEERESGYARSRMRG